MAIVKCNIRKTFFSTDTRQAVKPAQFAFTITAKVFLMHKIFVEIIEVSKLVLDDMSIVIRNNVTQERNTINYFNNYITRVKMRGRYC